MTSKEILEGNKLIAEFMNHFFNEEAHPYWDDECRYNPEYPKVRDLEYHSSWDWLMPVIKKINSINETEDRWGCLIRMSTTNIQISCKDFCYAESHQKGWEPFDIKRVYKAVVEFIKWYNKNK